jgi:hypothetical protein
VDGFTVAFAVGSGLMLAAFVVLSVWLRRGDVDVSEPDAAGHAPAQPAEAVARA